MIKYNNTCKRFRNIYQLISCQGKLRLNWLSLSEKVSIVHVMPKLRVALDWACCAAVTLHPAWTRGSRPGGEFLLLFPSMEHGGPLIVTKLYFIEKSFCPSLVDELMLTTSVQVQWITNISQCYIVRGSLDFNYLYIFVWFSTKCPSQLQFE